MSPRWFFLARIATICGVFSISLHGAPSAYGQEKGPSRETKKLCASRDAIVGEIYLRMRSIADTKSKKKYGELEGLVGNRGKFFSLPITWVPESYFQEKDTQGKNAIFRNAGSILLAKGFDLSAEEYPMRQDIFLQGYSLLDKIQPRETSSLDDKDRKTSKNLTFFVLRGKGGRAGEVGPDNVFELTFSLPEFSALAASCENYSDLLNREDLSFWHRRAFENFYTSPRIGSRRVYRPYLDSYGIHLVRGNVLLSNLIQDLMDKYSLSLLNVDSRDPEIPEAKNGKKYKPLPRSFYRQDHWRVERKRDSLIEGEKKVETTKENFLVEELKKQNVTVVNPGTGAEKLVFYEKSTLVDKKAEAFSRKEEPQGLWPLRLLCPEGGKGIATFANFFLRELEMRSRWSIKELPKALYVASQNPGNKIAALYRYTQVQKRMAFLNEEVPYKIAHSDPDIYRGVPESLYAFAWHMQSLRLREGGVVFRDLEKMWQRGTRWAIKPKGVVPSTCNRLNYFSKKHPQFLRWSLRLAQGSEFSKEMMEYSCLSPAQIKGYIDPIGRIARSHWPVTREFSLDARKKESSRKFFLFDDPRLEEKLICSENPKGYFELKKLLSYLSKEILNRPYISSSQPRPCLADLAQGQQYVPVSTTYLTFSYFYRPEKFFQGVKFKSLEKISFKSCTLSSLEFLLKIEAPNLEFLNFHRCRIDDTGLQVFDKDLTIGLKETYVFITDKALEAGMLFGQKVDEWDDTEFLRDEMEKRIKKRRNAQIPAALESGMYLYIKDKTYIPLESNETAKDICSRLNQ